MSTSSPGQSVDQGAPLTPRPQYTVHDKQQEVLGSDARFRVLCWGRRAGKNITASIDVIEYARNPAASRWGSDRDATIWWVGPTYDQANDHGFDTILSALPNAWIDGSPKRTKPRRIELINGVTIDFRTFDRPESLQGAGVDRMVIDEVAYMPRSLWDNDLEPMLMDNRGSAMFISKPKGRGLFHEMFQRGESDDFPQYDSFHATSGDNPFIAENPMDKRGEKPDRVFRQEYLAEFVDESGGVFSELDDRLFTLEDDVDDPTPPYAHGWDLARHEDYLVGIVLDAEGRLVHFHRSQHDAWPQIQSEIERVAGEYDGIVAIDASRDNKLVADLHNAGLAIEPVKFSPSRKRELVEDLITRVESGEISAPEIAQLRHELQVFEYDVTQSGTVRYHAPEGFHDDTVDALAMASDQLERIAATARRRDSRGEDENSGGLSYI